MANIYLEKNFDGSHNIIIMYDKNDAEFSMDFFSKAGLKSSLNKISDIIKEHSKGVKVNVIKVIIAGIIILEIPLMALSTVSAADRYNMAYLYGNTVTQQIEAVNKTNDVLDVVSPSYFDINSDGTLKLNTPSKTLIDEMHKKGIKVVPFLSNHWDQNAGINALKNSDLLTTEIAKYVEEYNLDGVNIDLENLTEVQRDDHTDFVAKLRSKIPANKEISVAVASNPFGRTKGWVGSYDYAGLAKHADYLMIMTYDEHYQGSEAGPVASTDFIEKSIQFALSQVSKDKIVLGLPFYGRIWKDDKSFNGEGIKLDKVSALIKEYNATVTYDEKYKTPKATFTVKKGDKISQVLSKDLTEGNYTIWYENDKSIEAKLNLIHKYDLKGSGSWSLGNEPESIWINYQSWLDNTSPSSPDPTTQSNTQPTTQPNTQTTTKPSTESSGTQTPATQETKGTVTANLNVRDKASTGGKIITTLSKGTAINIVSKESNGWYKIKLSNGKVGYVSGSYVKITSAASSSSSSSSSSSTGQKGTVTANLNVRDKSSTGGKIITTLSKGTAINIVSKESNGWYKIKLLNGKVGYVSGSYVQINK